MMSRTRFASNSPAPPVCAVRSPRLQRRSDASHTRVFWRATCRFIQSVLIVMFIVFPSVCAATLSTFRCTDYGSDGLLLDVDHTVDCRSDEYHAMRLWASVCVVLYPIGRASEHARQVSCCFPMRCFRCCHASVLERTGVVSEDLRRCSRLCTEFESTLVPERSAQSATVPELNTVFTRLTRAVGGQGSRHFSWG